GEQEGRGEGAAFAGSCSCFFSQSPPQAQKPAEGGVALDVAHFQAVAQVVEGHAQDGAAGVACPEIREARAAGPVGCEQEEDAAVRRAAQADKARVLTRLPGPCVRRALNALEEEFPHGSG